MDRREDIREFLISRRAKVSPEQAGIPSYGELRRVLDLARTANTPSSRTPRRPSQQRVRPGVLRLLDGMTGVAAMVQKGRGEVLAANMLGRALYS